MLRSLRIFTLGGTVAMLLAIAGWLSASVRAQTSDGGTITLRADVQEANALTGVITARGNVQVDYPTRQIYATSAQAQYFSEERRMILSGDVIVLQEGNRLEAETVTYLIDEGRFVALPQPNQQVRTTYILPASQEPGTATSSEGEAGSTTPGEDGSTSIGSFEPAATLDISPIESTDTIP
ncbi:MAG: hypothetical protein F6K42_08995 [Leptolyngbya sp. SIO1D8]|nr:hypothetical protein [Leptolyngbya sp. SIO1D8]